MGIHRGIPGPFFPSPDHRLPSASPPSSALRAFPLRVLLLDPLCGPALVYCCLSHWFPPPSVAHHVKEGIPSVEGAAYFVELVLEPLPPLLHKSAIIITVVLQLLYEFGSCTNCLNWRQRAGRRVRHAIYWCKTSRERHSACAIIVVCMVALSRAAFSSSTSGPCSVFIVAERYDVLTPHDQCSSPFSFALGVRPQCSASRLHGPHALLQFADPGGLGLSFSLDGFNRALDGLYFPATCDSLHSNFSRDELTLELHPWNSCLSSSFQDCLSSFNRVRKSSS